MRLMGLMGLDTVEDIGPGAWSGLKICPGSTCEALPIATNSFGH